MRNGFKAIAFFLMFILFSSNLSGQERSPKITISPYTGLTYSTLFKAESPFGYGDFKFRGIQAITYGGTFEFNIIPNLSIITGYSQATMGGEGDYVLRLLTMDRYEYRHKDIEVENTYNVIPLYIRGKIIRDRFTFFADAGVYYSLLRSSFVQYSINEFWGDDSGLDGMNIVSYYSREMDHTEENDFGIVTGIGVNYSLSSKFSISLFPQVLIGLKKIDKINSNNTSFIVQSSGPVLVVKNDYYGLSSDVTNFLISANIGISYVLF